MADHTLFDNDSTDCEACKQARKGLSWTGKPPKCPKHSENNVTWVK